MSRNYALILFVTLSRIIISGILALVVLTGFCTFYYNDPPHRVCLDAVTDFTLDADRFICQGREGFSWYITNNEGYNNALDYQEGMNINTLIIGSSHMAGMNVSMYLNAAQILGSLTNRTVYNIGMAGHRFAICAMNLAAALKKYKPSEYVIIETHSVSMSANELTEILDGTADRAYPIKAGLILSLLRENYFFALLHQQLGRVFVVKENRKPHSSAQNNTERSALLSEVLERMSKAVRESEAKLIIAFHPSVSLHENGTIRVTDDPEMTSQFAELCRENGIYFLDMSERFMKEYAENHILPYGFINTSVGKGHLNKYGHKMLAEEIYSLIQRIEAKS